MRKYERICGKYEEICRKILSAFQEIFGKFVRSSLMVGGVNNHGGP